ncbi:hypothetical protein [Francisella frigiditurris]|uniref:Lipoprotein n=1 Tax=Francisella frigiditurris TaxID=1542390 RepID=A0A1J0KRE2_9GAMM|nr:hypothetical protein [Francisella frigiditurris]APC96328.1 hypothetical protein KX01_1356 [Francisella frigiditurris]
MKIKSIFIIISTVLLSVLLIGCAQTVNNLNDQPIPSELSKDQIKQAIIVAGKQRGWVIGNSNKPDELTGKLLYNGDFVVVNIPYSEQGYSIQYKDSVGLDYDNVENKIDRDYNSWVGYLNQDIQIQLQLEAAQIRHA